MAGTPAWPHRRSIYEGRVVRLGIEACPRPGGDDLQLEIIRHPGAAAVLPLHADGTVTLVEVHRHAAGGPLLELPAGLIEPGEAPGAAAARELAEEVQLRAGALVPLGRVWTAPGYTDEQVHLFLGLDLSAATAPPDPDERLAPVRISVDEAWRRVRDGRIADAKTICALHLGLGAR
jgi:ADP-ribose pyrophosphatase